MFTIEKDKTKVEVNVTLTNQEWEEGLQKVYEKNKGSFSVVGFRKGHAPRKVIEKTYGDTVFFDDALIYFYEKVMVEVLTEHPEYEPVAKPQIQLQSYTVDNGVKLKFVVEVVPDFELCKYTDNTIEVHSAEATEKDVEHELFHLREDNAKFDDVDRPLKQGDVAVIDFMGFIDNVEFPGGTAEDYRVEIGSHSLVDTFEDQLVGHKKGETFDVNVTFPENYYEEFKGKKASFKVTVKEVKEKTLPTVDDKFIADATEYETLEEYRKATFAHIQTMKENQQEQEFEYNLRNLLVEKTNIELPESMISSNVSYQMRSLEEALAPYNLTLEQYILSAGQNSLEDYINGLRAQTIRNIKARLIYRRIANEQNIKVSEEELKAASEGVTDEDEIARIESQISLRKVHKFLREHNKTTVVSDDE